MEYAVSVANINCYHSFFRNRIVFKIIDLGADKFVSSNVRHILKCLIESLMLMLLLIL